MSQGSDAVRELLGATPRREAAQRLGLSERQLRRLIHEDGKRGPQRSTREAFKQTFGVDPWETQKRTTPRSAERLALGHRLRERRLQLGLTQEQVVDRARRRARPRLAAITAPAGSQLVIGRGLSLSVATVSRWENGTTAGRWESAFALAVALEIPFRDWFQEGLRPQFMPDLDALWQLDVAS